MTALALTAPPHTLADPGQRKPKPKNRSYIAKLPSRPLPDIIAME